MIKARTRNIYQWLWDQLGTSLTTSGCSEEIKDGESEDRRVEYPVDEMTNKYTHSDHTYLGIH